MMTPIPSMALANDTAIAVVPVGLTYPKTKTVDVVDEQFGIKVADPYRWLEDDVRVNAEVAVDMDFSVTEEARETFANDPAKIRSEQVSQNTVAGTGPEGVPGATSNTPPGPNAAAAPNPAAPVETSSSATRNFEMDRTLQHTRQPAGRVRRVAYLSPR